MFSLPIPHLSFSGLTGFQRVFHTFHRVFHTYWKLIHLDYVNIFITKGITDLIIKIKNSLNCLYKEETPEKSKSSKIGILARFARICPVFLQNSLHIRQKTAPEKVENFSYGKIFAFLRQFPLFFDKNMVYCYINTPVYAGKFSTQNVESVEKRKILKNPFATGFFW